MKKLFLIAIITLIANSSAFSQNYFYSYEYICNVNDAGEQVKAKLLAEDAVFKIKLTDNGSYCYLADSDGNFSDEDHTHSYAFVGTEDDMYKYESQFNKYVVDMGVDVMYFSKDYKEMYWQCEMDYRGSESSIRCLQRIDK